MLENYTNLEMLEIGVSIGALLFVMITLVMNICDVLWQIALYLHYRRRSGVLQNILGTYVKMLNKYNLNYDADGELQYTEHLLALELVDIYGYELIHGKLVKTSFWKRLLGLETKTTLKWRLLHRDSSKCMTSEEYSKNKENK